ncbi:MAG: flagellar basal body rod protein FlgB [Erysipelotrichaceae bacterium]
MFDSKSMKIMESGLDALWVRQKAISNNIANYETPGYKAKRVSFEEILASRTQNSQLSNIKGVKMSVSEDPSTSERLDGNNVDMEQEQLELWETYAQYSYLSNQISNQFSNLRYVINNTGK